MDRPEHDLSAIDAMAHGDERAARELRANVAVIARRTDDPSLRDLCVSILQGRESVRRMFAHPSFWAMAERNYQNLEEGLDRLSDEEREDLMDRIGEERTDDDEVAAMRDGAETEAVLADREAEAQRRADEERGEGPDDGGIPPRWKPPGW